MKLRNRILACLLASLTALAGLVSVVASAQTGDAYSTNAETPTGSKGYPSLPPEQGHAYIVTVAGGRVVCRDATPAERLQILKRDPSVRTSPYRQPTDAYITGSTDSKSSTSAVTAGHLDIILRPTAQLQANQAALAAFERAAATWENLITSEITVVIDADFGPTRFGEAFPQNVLGSTSGGIFYIPPYSDVRARLIAHASTADESNLFASLPSASGVPTDSGVKTQLDVDSPIARALGAIAPNANPNDTTGNDKLGNAPAMGFNSNVNFDFDRSDGIAPGKYDFESVVTHEIGHALGFSSEVGILEVDSTFTLRPTVWDLFRFRPGTTLATFATAQRVLTTGGEQRYFDGSPELALSTGNPEGNNGDGEQASHWKDDHFSGFYIGIMDPTLSAGQQKELTSNDRRAVDFMGYNLGALPAGPSNDNFVNAVTLQGTGGTVLGTNSDATKESGEPAPIPGVTSGGRSVWYSWTAPASGTATFDTVGSNFDTVLAIYTGGSVSSLSPVAANDDIDTQGGVYSSRVQFGVTAGTVYRIMVDGFDGDSGSFTLNWTLTGATPTPTPTPASYSVSGRVVDPDGSPLVNVHFSLDGPNLVNGFPHLGLTTDANGNYEFSLLRGGGNYTIRPDDSRYTFSPTTAVFNNINSNQTGVNFTATAPATITGTVSENSAPLQGVAVGLYGFNPLRLLKQTTTDANGRWTFNGATVGQSYNAVFLKSGYTFTPPTLIFPLNTASTDMGEVFATKTNPIEASEFFVTQNYRDFLGREPDASGLAFWTNEIESCGFDQQCRQVKRINVSGAFFLSIEFQNTGYLVERIYKTAFGDTTEQSTGLVVPIIRRSDFLADSAIIRNGVIVGVGNWQAQLDANKAAFAQAFVQRAAFTAAFPWSMTPAQFVAKLNQNTGSVLTQAQVDAIALEMSANMANGGAESARSVALRKVAESTELDRIEKSRAFVLMQYYGYLRRNPNDVPESNLNFAGWNFWLGKLIQANGDFVRAEMVKAFLDSTEYRQRFTN